MIVEDLRGSRPFTLDSDRQKRCLAVLENLEMTITELAFHLGHSKVYVGEIISGRRLTDRGETEIANFLGVPRFSIFPPRTAEQIYNMRQEELRAKQAKEELKQARMKLRKEALEKLGAA